MGPLAGDSAVDAQGRSGDDGGIRMKRYQIVKIKRGDYRVVVIAPDGEVAVVNGFRRKEDARMWIVEQTMAGSPQEPEPA